MIIDHVNQAGRFVVAAEDIKLGEPVTREEAYAAVLLRPYEMTHCHHCFTQEAVLIPYTSSSSFASTPLSVGVRRRRANVGALFR
jgi:hypothetical protein